MISPPQTIIISTPLEGTLLQNGKPLGKTKIFRKLEWDSNDEEGVVQEFMTDEDGKFALPAYEEVLSTPKIGQFVGYTEIYIEQDGEQISILNFAKMNKVSKEIFPETPRNMVCDITSPEAPVEIDHGLCMTKCRWDNMPEAQDPNAL